VGVLSFLTAQALLIFGLLVNRVRRGRVERALRESHGKIEYLAGRLILAQEEERRYLARELHDDLSQQVAALSIDLGTLGREAGDSVPARVAALQESANRVSDRIHQMSHDLHSSTLEHVGLAATLRAYCEEFTGREGIAVALRVEEGLDPISADAALCLYRVAQEALRNVAKHSGARTVEVTLSRSGESIELRVGDHGRGFDRKQAAAGQGLGLASMEERMKLLRGTLELKTRPGAGTEIRAQVPRGPRGRNAADRTE
jgi:signal transduction histidine kinase